MRAPFAVEKNWQYLLGIEAYQLPIVEPEKSMKKRGYIYMRWVAKR